MSTNEEDTDQRKNEPIPTEVHEPTGRRRYSLEYKQRIVAEVTAAPHGGVGVILRREGLYAATVRSWRAEMAQGSPKRKLGRPASSDTPIKREHERLMRENQRLERKLEEAGFIIAAQKKVADLLGIQLSEPPWERRPRVLLCAYQSLANSFALHGLLLHLVMKNECIVVC